ncbi:hypothetical protein NMY22_g18279 [Coprinellus aureogranulatus]|nr:hypothetical protein NMY22_g18279 [Coprinellus aureogranulatus]
MRSHSWAPSINVEAQGKTDKRPPCSQATLMYALERKLYELRRPQGLPLIADRPTFPERPTAIYVLVGPLPLPPATGLLFKMTVFWILPNIEYPVGREFESRLFNRLAYAAALLSLIVMTIVNVAIVGYEIDVVLGSNFNVTQSFWFNAFIPPAEPGTLCEPRVFNVGDSLVTNASLFEWKIQAITRPTAGRAGIAYNGATFEICDVDRMSFYGDVRTWTIGITTYVWCLGRSGVEVVASTTMTLSALPGMRAAALRDSASLSSPDPLNDELRAMFLFASGDAGTRAWGSYLQSNRTGIVSISTVGRNKFCSPSVSIVTGTPLPCATDPPLLEFHGVVAVDSTLGLMQDGSGPSLPVDFTLPYVLDDTMRPPITNILQLMLAVIRIDLGNPSPNNFLTHPQVLNRTLDAVFPETPAAMKMESKLFTYLREQALLQLEESGSAFNLFHVPGPSVVQTVYVCKLLKRKGAGNLIVSVFVASAGMFMSGWAVFICVARFVIEGKSYLRRRRWGL